MDMEKKIKYRGLYFEPSRLSILTSNGTLCYSNQKDERVERGNVLKKWSCFSPAHNDIKYLCTRPITFPFVYSSNASYVFMYLLRSVCLSLSLSLSLS